MNKRTEDNYRQQLINIYQTLRGVGLALCCTSMLAFILAFSQPVMGRFALPCLVLGATMTLFGSLKVRRIYGIPSNKKKVAGLLLIILPVIMVLLTVFMYALAVFSYEEGGGSKLEAQSRDCVGVECIEAGSNIVSGGDETGTTAVAGVIGLAANVLALLASPLVCVGSRLLVSTERKSSEGKKIVQHEDDEKGEGGRPPIEDEEDDLL